MSYSNNPKHVFEHTNANDMDNVAFMIKLRINQNFD